MKAALPFWGSIAALVLGVVVGTASDERPARPETRRGPWRVLEADFHAHSRFSDGFLSPPELVMQADRRGLDVLAVTEHNMLFPAKLARAWSELVGGPTIVLGEEVTTRDYHVHAIGISERVSPSTPLAALIDEVHAQGGIVIAAHPVRRFWPRLLPVIRALDGMELMHPIALRAGPRPADRAPDGPGGGPARAGWSAWDLPDFYAEAQKVGKTLTVIGSSDYHFGGSLGLPRTLVFAASDSADDVLAALKAGRTVVTFADGSVWGDAECRRLLAAEPYTPRVIDYANTPTGPIDAAARALGLLGLAGLVFFRRGRSVSVADQARRVPPAA